ncbi:MAG TPA: hypothetical protein VGH67_01935 [Solirubrobacteraceae bacterium]
MKRISTIVVAVVALLLGATTYAAVTRPGSSTRTAKPRHALTVTAKMSGLLYPGSIRPLRLRVKNLLPRKVKALAVDVKVGKPTGRCPAWAVVGGRFAVRVTLPRGATRTVWASLRMLPSSPNACQGAQIPLSFSMTLDGRP